MVLRSIFEILLVGFTVWAVFNEDRFAALEERLVCKLRRKALKTVSACHERSGALSRIK